MPDQHWLIFDGDCSFCQHSVAWVGRHDRAGRFRPEPFQTCPSPPMTPELRAAAARAVQVVTSDGQRIAAGHAVLFILAEVGWHPRLVGLGRQWPLSWLVEVGYHAVSRTRGQLGRLLFRRGEDSP